LPALLWFACVATLQAHESRPAYLQLTIAEPDGVRLLFKVPALGDRRLGLYPRLPENCNRLGDPLSTLENNAYTERAQYRCEGGLTGKAVSMDGLSSTLTDVLVRVERADGSTQVTRMTPAEPVITVEASTGLLSTAGTYLAIGVEHILSGIDHLLFVLALLLLVKGTRKLIWTITAFTAAHSLTLAAATLGWVTVPQVPIEAVITLSIVFVASEIIHARRGRPGLAQQKPWIIAFAFGLLHGFGFAGALLEVGLPEPSVPLALLFFNIGVEIGQLLFILVALTLIRLGHRFIRHPPPWLPSATAYSIGIVAAFWTIERVFNF
jgi:hydrogenase/urease accessory protein HupE